MTNIAKRIKEEDLKVFTIFDSQSQKGFPTANSAIITIVVNKKTNQYGLVFKARGVTNVPRLAQSIAYQNLKIAPRSILVEDGHVNELWNSIYFSSAEFKKKYSGKNFNDFINLMAHQVAIYGRN